MSDGRRADPALAGRRVLGQALDAVAADRPDDPGAPVPLTDFSGLLERGAHLIVAQHTKLYGPTARRVFSNDAMLGLGLDTYT